MLSKYCHKRVTAALALRIDGKQPRENSLHIIIGFRAALKTRRLAVQNIKGRVGRKKWLNGVVEHPKWRFERQNIGVAILKIGGGAGPIAAKFGKWKLLVTPPKDSFEEAVQARF